MKKKASNDLVIEKETNNEHFEIVYVDKDTSNTVTVIMPTKTQALVLTSRLKNIGHKLLSRARILEKESITRKVTATNF